MYRGSCGSSQPPPSRVSHRLDVDRDDEGTPVRGMLFSQMEPPANLEVDFNVWYDEEHIPDRLAIDGFERADRYVEVDAERRYLAVYQLSDLAALDDPAYRRLKDEPSERTSRMLSSVSGFTRFTCEMTFDSGKAGDHNYLAAVAFPVDDADAEQFDDWYDTEHAPMLLEADDWLRVRRYRVRSGDGGPWTHFALHELASREVMDSDERRAAREGPKRDALVNRPWFSQSGRWLYRRLGR